MPCVMPSMALQSDPHLLCRNSGCRFVIPWFCGWISNIWQMNIRSQLGISVSNAVNMFSSQIVLRGGIPFDVTIPSRRSMVVMSSHELAAELEPGCSDLIAVRTVPADDVKRTMMAGTRLLMGRGPDASTAFHQVVEQVVRKGFIFRVHSIPRYVLSCHQEITNKPWNSPRDNRTSSMEKRGM